MFGIEEDFQQLMEQFYGPLGEKQPPDTIEIGGVKYKRVEEPPTLYDKLETWIEYGNFAQSKDVLVNEILNIVKEFIPDTCKNKFMSEYLLGYNEAIKEVNKRLK
jgi:hypothetical protein